MNGPLEENARADKTARTSPDVLTRWTAVAETIGIDAVGAAMGIRLSTCQECTVRTLVTLAFPDVRSQHGVHP
ncbi:hypothetical protein GCM10009807_16320 [Microbacterium lacus]|uniref:Uncharacterized protein n=1 Tax=Microbacterium lacus TaxID=415217 RepID=A0ABP4SPP4_9MICO